MTTPINDGQIVKQDSKGRLRITKERRESLLAEYDQGGMTGAAFARWAGVPYATFMTWLTKRRKAAKPSVKTEQRTQALEWVEAVVEKSTEAPVKEPKKEPALIKSGAALVVEAPGGIRLELSEEKHVLWAAKLLRHLGEVC
jgi:hypothetical protein